MCILHMYFTYLFYICTLHMTFEISPSKCSTCPLGTYLHYWPSQPFSQDY